MKLFAGLAVGIGAIVLVALMAVLSGTILFLIWPVAAEPFIDAGAGLPAALTWWQAVCVTWVFSILIKASQTNNNKD